MPDAATAFGSGLRTRRRVIDLTGDVTAACENELMDAYGEASEEEIRGIVLDFTGLDYMNSSGIGLLVTLLVRAKREGQQMQRLRAVGPLPADLRADPPRRGHRHARPRGDALAAAHGERRRWIGCGA